MKALKKVKVGAISAGLVCQEGVKWGSLVMACSRQDSSGQLKSVLGTQADDLTRKKNCSQTTHEGVAEELPPGHRGGLQENGQPGVGQEWRCEIWDGYSWEK